MDGKKQNALVLDDNIFSAPIIEKEEIIPYLPVPITVQDQILKLVRHTTIRCRQRQLFVLFEEYYSNNGHNLVIGSDISIPFVYRLFPPTRSFEPIECNDFFHRMGIFIIGHQVLLLGNDCGLTDSSALVLHSCIRTFVLAILDRFSGDKTMLMEFCNSLEMYLYKGILVLRVNYCGVHSKFRDIVQYACDVDRNVYYTEDIYSEGRYAMMNCLYIDIVHNTSFEEYKNQLPLIKETIAITRGYVFRPSLLKSIDIFNSGRTNTIGITSSDKFVDHLDLYLGCITEEEAEEEDYLMSAEYRWSAYKYEMM